jgi:hypothetical protein
MTNALKILKMPEEEPFVKNMKSNMGRNVAYVTAHEINLMVHRHVSDINRSGENINLIIVTQAWLELKECHKGLKKKIRGNLAFAGLFSLMMMIMMLKFHAKFFLVLANSTVWKQFVHHVVLSLLGPSLINQNHRQIF